MYLYTSLVKLLFLAVYSTSKGSRLNKQTNKQVNKQTNRELERKELIKRVRKSSKIGNQI